MLRGGGQRRRRFRPRRQAGDGSAQHERWRLRSWTRLEGFIAAGGPVGERPSDPRVQPPEQGVRFGARALIGPSAGVAREGGRRQPRRPGPPKAPARAVAQATPKRSPSPRQRRRDGAPSGPRRLACPAISAPVSAPAAVVRAIAAAPIRLKAEGGAAVSRPARRRTSHRSGARRVRRGRRGSGVPSSTARAWSDGGQLASRIRNRRVLRDPSRLGATADALGRRSRRRCGP